MSTQFQAKVQEAVREGLQRELALEFDVAEATVWSWSSGKAKPHPKVQTEVIKFVEAKKT